MEKKPIKCVVWDLDDTLWEGVLTEAGANRLRPGVEAAIKDLDSRGIIQSIAADTNSEKEPLPEPSPEPQVDPPIIP